MGHLCHILSLRLWGLNAARSGESIGARDGGQQGWRAAGMEDGRDGGQQEWRAAGMEGRAGAQQGSCMYECNKTCTISSLKKSQHGGERGV